MFPMISAIRCSFFRMSAASWAGGRCVMSSLARGFLRSRLHPFASNSAAGTFHGNKGFVFLVNKMVDIE